MKYFTLSILICISSGCNQTTAPASSQEFAAFIDIDSAYFDFGTIEVPEEGLNHTFILKNRSNDTLLIDRAEAGCDCLDINYCRTIIFPKDTISVSVKYHPGQEQKFEKDIAIFFNSGEYYAFMGLKGTRQNY